MKISLRQMILPLCPAVLFSVFLTALDAKPSSTDPDLDEIAIQRKPQISPTDSSRKLALLISSKVSEKNYSLADKFIKNTTASYSVSLDGKPMGEVKFLFGDKYPQERCVYDNILPKESIDSFESAITLLHTTALLDTPISDELTINAIKQKNSYLVEIRDPENPDRVAFFEQISSDFKVLQREIATDISEADKQGEEQGKIGTAIITEHFERFSIGKKYLIRKMVRYIGPSGIKRVRFNYEFEYREYKDAVFFSSIQITVRIPNPKKEKYTTLNFSLKLKNVIFEKQNAEGGTE